MLSELGMAMRMRIHADWCAYAHMRMRLGRQNLYVHSRQNNMVKNRTKLAHRRARAKTVKILNKNSQKSIKNKPKNGPKMVIFLLLWCGNAYIRASMRYDSASPKTSTWPTLVTSPLTDGPLPKTEIFFAENGIFTFFFYQKYWNTEMGGGGIPPLNGQFPWLRYLRYLKHS